MTGEASTTTWETLVEQYRERAARDDARIDELRQSTEHWHDTAQMLKRQRDTAEEERDGWKERALKAVQERQVIRKNMDDLIVNVNVAMAERERELRAERDALRNYVEEKLNITKLTRLRGEELDRYILALVNAEANCEALHTTNTNLRDLLMIAEGQRDQAKMRAEAAEAERDEMEQQVLSAERNALAVSLSQRWRPMRLDETKAECDSLRKYLLDLLAVVHRDGGHHTEAVGTRQSVVDAELAVHALRKDAARLDWMESERVLRASFYPLCFPPCWVVEASEMTSGETLRVAIDVAMLAQPTTGEGA